MQSFDEHPYKSSANTENFETPQIDQDTSYLQKLTMYDYYLWFCLIPWIAAMVLLFLSQDIPFGAIFQILIYLFFIITHAAVLILRHSLRSKANWLRVITVASIVPSFITGAITITLFVLLILLQLKLIRN